jgi:ATP-dependent exoDNAse (exonuclease V) beta subunit
MSKQWSAYQTKIFDFVRSGGGNTIVNAVAGSGKTTTIVEARQDWQQRQELNLCYVAVTRAKQQLILIEEKRDAA